MAFRCDHCGKGSVWGGSHTHHRGVAGGRWLKKAPRTRRLFKPNLHKWMGKKLCTKCLRRLKGLKSKTITNSQVATGA